MSNRQVLGAVHRAIERDDPTVVISNSPLTREPGGPVMSFDPQIAEWLTPIPTIVIAELFTYHVTIEQRDDPDSRGA